MDKFGWFYARNGTTWSDGVLTMDTGTDDIAKLGDIRQVTLIAKQFNGFLTSDRCSMNANVRLSVCHLCQRAYSQM